MTCLVLAILLQQTPLSGSDFAKSVSLKLKQVPIAEAVAKFDDATPLNLAIAPNIANLKVTILVKDQPCGKVMEQVASVLMCEWKEEKGGFRLIQPSLVSSQMQAYIAAENRVLRQNAETELRELMARTKTAEEEIQKQKDAGKTVRRTNEQDQRTLLAGSLLRSLSASGWGGFWQGDVLVGEAPVREDSNVTVALTFSPILHQTLMQSSMGPTGALMGPSRIVVRRIPFQTPPSSLADLAFMKQVRDWGTPIQTSADEKPLDLSDVNQPGKSPTLAEVLSVVHEQTGMPIVAEGFRLSASFDRRSAKDLKSFLTAISAYSNHSVRTDGPWILVRNGHFWRNRPFEPPETSTVALEKLSKQRPLNLSDYASYARTLNDTQVMAFRLGEPKIEFNVQPLKLALPALRFFGLLSDRQQKAALSGEVIPYQNLTATQRDLFNDAMASAAFAEADSLSWKSGLLSGKAPVNQPLYFRASAEPVFPLGRPRPGGRNTGITPTIDVNKKIPGFIFQFGISPEKRIGYVLPVGP